VEVPTEEFLGKFYTKIGRKLPDTSATATGDPNDPVVKRKCLEAILIPAVATGTASKFVSLERFGLLLTWFGPLVPVDKTCILDKVHFALRESWYFGDINRDESVRLLTSGDNPTAGRFLIRTSNLPQHPFTLSRVFRDKSSTPQSKSSKTTKKTSALKTEHLRISYNNGIFTLQFKQEDKTRTFSASTLPALMNDRRVGKALRLKEPILRQRYGHIFNNIEDGGYRQTEWQQPVSTKNDDDESDE